MCMHSFANKATGQYKTVAQCSSFTLVAKSYNIQLISTDNFITVPKCDP